MEQSIIIFVAFLAIVSLAGMANAYNMTFTFVVPALVENITLQATSCYPEQEIWARATIVCKEPTDCAESLIPATINLPSSFTIVNDVNIHYNPAIPYEHYWATEWVIRCANTTGAYNINVTIPDSYKATTVIVNHAPSNPTLSVHGTEYVKGAAGIVYAQILDEDGTPINVANCSTSIYYPDKTIWVSYDDMTYLTQSLGFYYYNFVAPDTEGIYAISVNCTDPTAYGASTFHVSSPINASSITVNVNATNIAEQVWKYPSGVGNLTMQDFLIENLIFMVFGGNK